MSEISITKQYNYVALEWVKNEITATLKQARQSLEAFVENPTGQDLDFCLSFIHQVRAVLDMVELTEAANLTIEMEHLAQRLLRDEIAQNNKNEALEVLMQSIIHLPLYLERVQDNRSENQLLILTLLNDLRAARGDDLLAQTSQIAIVDLPKIVPLPSVRLDALNTPEFISHLRKLRQMLQLALVNIIRGNQVDTNLNHLAKIFNNLEKICANSPSVILWEVAGALVAGLHNGEILAGAAVRTLLRKIDSELKNLIEQGVIAINLSPPEDLIKNILFYISKTPGRSPKITALKQKYNIADFAVDETEINATNNILDNATLVTVVTSLTEEINKVKDVLDLFVRGNRSDTTEITALKPQFNIIADTLVVLNASEARQLVIEQIGLLDDIAAGNRQIDHNLLLGIAGAILQVEVKLNSMLELDEENSESMPTSDVNIVNTVVIREAILDIEKTKEIIVEYINSDWNNEILAKTPSLMSEVYSVLMVIPLNHAAQLFKQCQQYIEEQLLGLNRNPSWEELDHLADAISSIEYYLESIVTDYDGEHEKTLELAEANLQMLIKLTPTTSQPNVDKTETADDLSVNLVDDHQNSNELNVLDLDNDSSKQEETKELDNLDFIDSFELDTVDLIQSNNDTFNFIDFEQEKISDEIIDNKEEDNTNDVELESVSLTENKNKDEDLSNKTATPQDVSIENLNLPQLLPPPADEAPIDEELREIFIEEVTEVLETINEFLPKWRNDVANKNALTEVRRAFHTLKGSGRMVRALVLGELAWSIENLLNRVLDKTIVATDDLLDLVQQVVDLTPKLCKEFELLQQRRRNDVDFLAAKAHAMSKGETLQQLQLEQPSNILPVEKEVKNTETTNIKNNVLENKEVILNQEPQELPLPLQTEKVNTLNVIDDFNFELLEESPNTEIQQESKAEAPAKNLDYKLIDIFQSETQGHLDVLNAFCNDFNLKNGIPQLVTAELHRALHTLKGSASMADISSVLAIVMPLEQMAKFCKSHDILWSKIEVDLLLSSLKQIKNALIQLNLGNLNLSEEAIQTINAVEQINAKHIAQANEQRQSVTSVMHKKETINNFLSFGMDVLSNVEKLFDVPFTATVAADIGQQLLQLQNKATSAEQAEVIELCAILQQIYAVVAEQKIELEPYVLVKLKEAYEELIGMLDQIAVHWHANRNLVLVQELQQLKLQLVIKTKEKLAEHKQNLPKEPTKPVINLDWKVIKLFLEDAQDALDSASLELEAWLGNPSNTMGVALILSELRTLKNGARMAQLPEVLELTQELENLYRGVRTKKYPHSNELASLLLRCHEALTNQFDCLHNQQSLMRDVDLLQAIANFKNDGNPPNGGSSFTPPTNNSPNNDLLSNLGSNNGAFNFEPTNISLNDSSNDNINKLITSELKEESSDLSDNSSDNVINQEVTNFKDVVDSNNKANSNNANNLLDDEQKNNINEDFASNTVIENEIVVSEGTTIDTDLIAMITPAVQDSINAINKILSQWAQQTSNVEQLKKVIFELNNIQEQAELTELHQLGQFVQQLQQIYQDLIATKLFYRPALLEFLQEANKLMFDYLESLTNQQSNLNLDDFWQKFAAIKNEAITPFIEDKKPPIDVNPVTETAATNAAVVYYESELLPTFLEEAQDVLENANNALARWIDNPENLLELASLQRDLHTVKGGARMAEVAEMATFAHELEYLYEALNDGRLQINAQLFELLNTCHDQLSSMLDDLRLTRTMPSAAPFIAAVQSFRADPSQYQAVPLSVSVQDAKIEQADADLLEIFFDEATELLEEFEATLAAWDKNQSDAAPIRNIMRILHTLKGSARLAKLNQIGDLSHNIEQQITECTAQNKPVSSIGENIQSGYLQLCKLLEDAKKQSAAPAVVTSAPTKNAANNVAASQQEMIKVAAAQIDNLVNLAGETSIYRGRIEQQVSDFGLTLTEMESTIERVRDQLRRLDIETQAQILSNFQEERANYEDFDPLEMDRHSHLQQLSRSLFESASDLLDLTSTLHNKSRDTQTLLLQQAQINTELQEGLMRTRMIPFAKIAPRLNRIVRQLSRELGKQVELKIINADNEMDRSVLERVIAPLEHMLRNAIDHGIEDVATRQSLGKPPIGQISLELNREGGDIVLSLKDDGAGINVAKVRSKAIERGLMQSGSDLSDREIIRFVLEAGFSTAQKVTQVSGRGVGMDVAISEVKQIGGVIDIDSEFGSGTTFSIRLPFTLSVNRALMVYSGDDLYAIPLDTIDGIVRITPQDLAKYYGSSEARFDYAGQDYDLRYFGDLIHSNHQPKLSGSNPLPVILVRSREYAVAVQVDALAGSHEIVVKNLGPQFAVVPGLSGATLLGDGRVVIILDLLATIRQLHSQIGRKKDEIIAEPINSDVQRQIKVMVVDDSVTVRKVTTRLLERRGVIVSTAKDGVDAITQLQDDKPDVMLLDIEMPRMDGFEVASTIRHDERLQDLPIIMITSRTGDKHRERAMSIGVNSYLGKPYQEDQLVETIEQLVGVKI